MIHKIRTREEMKKELQDLKYLVQTDPETAKIIARIALIRSGLLDKNVKSKDRMVDHPHTGCKKSKSKKLNRK